jgi:hypothetical protein
VVLQIQFDVQQVIVEAFGKTLQALDEFLSIAEGIARQWGCPGGSNRFHWGRVSEGHSVEFVAIPNRAHPSQFARKDDGRWSFVHDEVPCLMVFPMANAWLRTPLCAGQARRTQP